MSAPRGNFAAIPTSAHHSPPLLMLRHSLGPLGDVYFYRALLFCKEYLRSGELVSSWSALACYAAWPDDPEAMQLAFRAAGAVCGPKDELWEWHQYNGWLIQMRKRAADKKARQRAAGRASGRARRLAKRARVAVQKSNGLRTVKRLQKVSK